MFAILRTKKHKSIASVKRRESHTYRFRETPNADPAKLKNNKLLFGCENYSDGLKTVLEKYKAAGNNIRKDGVYAIEYLLTASPEFFEAGSKKDRTDRLNFWCAAQIEFVTNMHGVENILCMYLHLDEKTPHIEVYAVPIDPKGKLNCKHFLGSPAKLIKLQTDYASHNASFNLKRGQEGSRATHEDVKRFYALIKGKTKITNQDVMKAVKIDQPTVIERLDPTKFIEIQQNKIFNRISKLFSGTVYENKLIAQAKKIMREWTRSEKKSAIEKDKFTLEIEELNLKFISQNNLIKSAENLNIENMDLKNQINYLFVENKELKMKSKIPKI